MKNINIETIAKEAGVSIATVSRALNGSNLIKEETRQKILSIANQFNFRPNQIAKGLSTRRTDTIGLILPDLIGEFFMEVIHSVDEEAHRANKFLLVASSHSQRDSIETLVEFMSSGRVDGVILMAPKAHDKISQITNISKKPVVLLNTFSDNNDLVSISANNFQGASTVVNHLIDHGYKRIGMIKGPVTNCEADERYAGFRSALTLKNKPIYENLIVEGDFTIKSGYYGLLRLMSQAEKPDAIFSANDMMCIGIYEAAKSLGLNIPNNIAIVGYDDVFLGRLLNPRLTTIHVPIAELGSKSVQYLLKMINEEVDPSLPYKEVLSTGLIIGGSCGCKHSSSIDIL